MNIVKVSDKILKKIFHNIPRLIYNDDPAWICTPDAQIESIFNPKKNNCFNNGEADRYILFDANKDAIGRIAVFIDHNKKNNSEYTTGGFGFFECVNDKEAARLLFDTAKQWLQEKGAEAMNGPINFGENFQYWGLLVEGFVPQGIGMPFNKPYYKDLFESYGLKNYFEQYSYHKNLKEHFPERMWKFAKYIGTRPDYRFEYFKYKQIDKFIDDIVIIYDDTWSHFLKGYTHMKNDEIRKLLTDMKPILVEKMIWFAYKNDRPIGFMIGAPDVNQIFKHLNGKSNFLSLLKFFWYKKQDNINRIRLILAGVIPEFHNSGIIAGLFYHFANTVMIEWSQYSEIELSWVGDYNPKMRKLYIQMGGELAKTHITYRYIFDKDATFTRFTNK